MIALNERCMDSADCCLYPPKMPRHATFSDPPVLSTFFVRIHSKLCNVKTKSVNLTILLNFTELHDYSVKKTVKFDHFAASILGRVTPFGCMENVANQWSPVNHL